jgi:predicted DNA-binding protein YlxM (UPF0122 family)
MHNIVIDRARARRRQPRELFTVHDRGDPRSGDAVTGVELRPALLAALGTLTAQQRAIVVLRYFEDLSENDVANLLGVSTGTVKSTASRAVADRRRAGNGLRLPDRAHYRYRRVLVDHRQQHRTVRSVPQLKTLRPADHGTGDPSARAASRSREARSRSGVVARARGNRFSSVSCVQS